MSPEPDGRHFTPQGSLKPLKYAFMSMFLIRVLNLDDEMLIVRSSRVAREKIGQGKLPPEILPKITMPPTLWLQEEIVLPEATIKAALLREINAMLQRSIQTLQLEELFLLDDNTLLYYEKLLNAYDFLKFDRTPPLFDAFREDDEYEDFDVEDPVSVYPSSSGSALGRGSTSDFNRDLNRQASSSRLVSSGSYKSRMSTLLKDFRKLSFLGLNGQPPQSFDECSDPTPPLPVLPQSAPQRSALVSSNPAQHPHREHLSTILSKSKFYNKLRRRDSAASFSSALSTPTSMTSNVSTGSGRRKSTQGEPKKPKERLSEAQKQENQRAKLEYYVQVRELAKSTKMLAGFLGKPGSRASLVRLMEFVKNNVFRLVLIDISSMIVDYAHLKALRAL